MVDDIAQVLAAVGIVALHIVDIVVQIAVGLTIDRKMVEVAVPLEILKILGLGILIGRHDMGALQLKQGEIKAGEQQIETRPLIAVYLLGGLVQVVEEFIEGRRIKILVGLENGGARRITAVEEDINQRLDVSSGVVH